MAKAPISLKVALFWMNSHRELLAVDQRALARIRAHSAGFPGCDDVDVRLVSEVARVVERLEFWEDMVDKANGLLLQPA